MEKRGKILVIAAIILGLLLAALGGLYFWQRSQDITVDGVRYPGNASRLDLRQEEVSISHYENLQKALPDCEIIWNVPFQKRHYASSTKKITVTSLEPQDVENLQYLKDLETVDASNCFDYEALQLLRESRPDCHVIYSVALDGEIYDQNVEALAFGKGRGEYDQLSQRLAYLPALKTVSFEEPAMSAQELLKLREAYPQIRFTWEKELFGQTLSDDVTRLDISGMTFENIREVEAQTDYLPTLEKLTMCNTGLNYEDIAQFRERSRERFKVIFNVQIGPFDVRTDTLWFKPSKYGKEVRDCDMRYMKYCEDMVLVDLSRSVVRNIDWVKGTPHLKYLIISGSPLRDIQALRSAKELKLLALPENDLRDLRPLVDCTALEDLNLIKVFSDTSPVGEMQWLKNLWISGGSAHLKEKLPKTHVNAGPHTGNYGGGWTELPNYKEMQAILAGPAVPEA